MATAQLYPPLHGLYAASSQSRRPSPKNPPARLLSEHIRHVVTIAWQNATFPLASKANRMKGKRQRKAKGTYFRTSFCCAHPVLLWQYVVFRSHNTPRHSIQDNLSTKEKTRLFQEHSAFSTINIKIVVKFLPIMPTQSFLILSHRMKTNQKA